MKKLSQIIEKTNQQLSTLMATESLMRELKRELVQLDLFATHHDAYRFIKFSQGILYLSVLNSAFATQIRYVTPEILRILQNKLPNIKLYSIHCKVSTFSSSPKISVPERHTKIKAISEKTRVKLATLAKTVPSTELREALQRLASQC